MSKSNRAEKFALPFIHSLYFLTRVWTFLFAGISTYFFFTGKFTDFSSGDALSYCFSFVQMWIAGSLLFVLHRSLRSLKPDFDKIVQYLLFLAFVDLVFSLQKLFVPSSGKPRSIGFLNFAENFGWSDVSTLIVFSIELVNSALSFLLIELSGGTCLVLIGLILLWKNRKESV